MKRLAIFVLIGTVLLGCSTQREISPKIDSPIRTDLMLKNPIQASVFDGRTTSNNIDAAPLLEDELKRIYGLNMEWAPYFKATPGGRLSIKYRIVNIGSNFGSRIISATSYQTVINKYQVSVPNAWNAMFINGTSNATIRTSTFSGEGWWNGGAWVDIEIDDNRQNKHIKFVIPIAAEHQESNMLGYSSGDKAALIAWQAVAAQIIRITDSIIISIQDNQS